MNKEDYTNISFKVYKPTTLKKEIKKRLSFKQAQELIKKGKIRVNEESVHLSEKLTTGDIVNFYLPIKVNKNENIVPIDKEINIIYEDEDVLVINKEPNLLTISNYDTKDVDNLAGRILHYYETKNIKNNAIQFLSRLDRETSGIILVAKNSYAHSKLQKAQNENKVYKTYLCVVHGKVPWERKNVLLNIKKSNKLDRFEISKNGEYARTLFNRLHQGKEISVLSAKLFTGKTHQIRLHTNAVKHPLVGEKKYFQSKEDINRFALHSWKLSFIHPRSNKILEFKATIPKDIERYLKNKDESTIASNFWK